MRRAFAAIALSTIAALSVSNAIAGSQTWAGGTATWDTGTATDWSAPGTTTPTTSTWVSASDAIMNNGGQANINTTVYADSISDSSTPLTLAGTGTLQLGSGSTNSTATGYSINIQGGGTNFTVNSGLTIQLMASSSWAPGNNNGLFINGNVTDSGAGTSAGVTLTLNNSGGYNGKSVQLNGTNTFGALSIVGGNSDALTLGGPTTLFGNLTISGGSAQNSDTLYLNNAAFTAGALVINTNYATLDSSKSGGNTLTTTLAENWNGGLLTYGGTNSLNLGTGGVTLGTNVILNASGTNGSNVLTVGGVISDGGNGYSIYKVGAGSLTLNGANTYTGGTTVAQGLLTFGNSTAADIGNVMLTGGGVNGSTLAYGYDFSQTDLNHVVGNNAGTTIAEGSATPAQNLNFSNESNVNFGATVNSTYSGTISPGGNGYLLGGGGAILTLSGTNALTGAASVTVGGGGTGGGVALTGANNYTGATTITGVSPTNPTTNPTTLTFSGAGTAAGSVGFTIGQGGALTLSNANLANSTARLGSTAAITLKDGTFNFNNDASNNTFAQSTGNLNVGVGFDTIGTTQAGSTGTSTLTFSGMTRTAGSTLNFTDPNVGAGTRDEVKFTTAPTLVGGGTGILPYATVNGGNFATYGADGIVVLSPDQTSTTTSSWLSTDNAATTSGTYTVAQNTTINSLTLAGTGLSISNSDTLDLGSGGLADSSGNQTVSGSGTLTVGASNVGGELIVNSSQSPAISAVVANNGTGVVSLTSGGSGTLTLSGANIYTGATTIDGGTIALGANSSGSGAGLVTQGPVGTGTVTVAGGTLQMNGKTLYNNMTAQAGTNSIIDNAGGNGYFNGNLSGSGTITEQNSSGTNLSFVVGSNNAVTWSGFTGALNYNSTYANNNILFYTSVDLSHATVNISNATNNASSSFYLAANNVTVQVGALSGTSGYLYSNFSGGTFQIGSLNTNTTFGGSGGIAGSVNLTKVGTGTLTLSGANTYNGATTISAGTLLLGGTGQLGSGNYAGNISIAGSSNFIYGSSSGQTLSGVISGNGTLVQNGTGSLALSSANTFTGGVTLSAGMLTVGNNSALGTGTLALQGGILNGNSGSSLVLGNSIVLSGTPSQIYTSWSNLTLTGALSGNGNLTLGNSGTSMSFFLSFASNTMTSGTITLANNTNSIRFGSATSGNANVAWVFNNTVTGRESLDFTGTNTINFGSMTGNGTIGGNSSSGTTTISEGNLDLNDLFSGVIANSVGTTGMTVGLTKVGTGTLTLSGANTYTGATTISAGTLIIGGAGQLANGSYAGAVADNGTLTLGSSANQTLSGAITGTGALKMSGAGTLTLSGANTYTGGTALIGGTLLLNNGAGGTTTSSALGTGSLTISGGTTIDSTVTGVTLGTNNAQNWNGDFTYTGTQSLNLGTGAVTLGASRQVTVNAHTLTVGGAISDGGNGYGLTKTGAGSLLLTGASTYSGGTTLIGGKLLLNNGASGTTTSSAIGTGSLTIEGGTKIDSTALGITLGTNNTQYWNGDFIFTGTQSLNLGTGAVTLGSSRQVNVNAKTLTVGGAIGDGGNGYGLTEIGTGTLILSGVSSYSGPTTISGGTMNIASNGSLASGSTVAVNGTSTLSDNGTVAGAVNVNGGGTLSGSGAVGGLVTVAGGNSSTTEGKISTVDGAIGTLTLNGGLTLGGAAGNLSLLDLEANNTASDLITLGSQAVSVGAGGANITITGLGVTAGKTYTILSYGSASGAGFADGSGSTTVGDLTLANPNLAFGVSGTLTVTGGAGAGVVEVVTTNATAAANAYWSGAQGSTWASNNGMQGNFTTTLDGATYTNSLPASATAVIFSNNGSTNLTNTLGATFDIASLAFLGSTNHNGAVTINADGNTLTLESGGLTMNSGAGAVTIGSLVGLNGPQTWENDSTANLTMSGAISGVSANGLTINNTSTGMTILSGPNTYSGGTTLAAGTLQLSGSGTLGATTGSLAISGSGTLDLAGSSQRVGALTLGTGGSLITTSSGPATLTTTGVTVNGTGNAVDSNVTVVGNATFGNGAALIDNGAVTGTMTVGNGNLSGAGSVSGAVSVTSGTVNGNGLALNGGTAFNSLGNTLSGTVTSDVTMASGGVVTQTGTLTGSLTSVAGTFTDNGTVTGSAALSSGGALNGTGSIGAVSLAGNNTLSSLGTLTTGGITVDGTGNAISSGTVGGNVTINNLGLLNVGGGATASGTVSVMNGGTLSGTGTTGTVTVNSGGAVNLADGALGTLSVGSLSITAGALIFEIGGTTTATDKIASGSLTIGTGTTVTIANLSGTAQTLANGTYNLITYAGADPGLGNLSLSTATLDGARLTLVDGTGAIELQVINATSTTYNLITTAGATRIISGQSTPLTTTIVNMGTGASDTLNFTGLGTTGTTVSGATTSGGPLAEAGGTASNTGQTFSDTTTGAHTITSTDDTVTNALLGGSAALGTTTPATIDVLNNRVVTASAVTFGRVMAGVAVSGMSTLSTTGDDADSTRVTVGTVGPDANGINATGGTNPTFNSASATDTRTVGGTFSAAGNTSGALSLDTTGEGLAGESPINVTLNYSADAVNNRTETATAVNLGRVLVGQPSATQTTTISSVTNEDSLYTRTTLAGAAQSAAGVSNATITLSGGTDYQFGGANDAVNSTERGVSGSFTTAGTQSGTALITPTGEGLAGEVVNSIGMGYTVDPVTKRIIANGAATDLGTLHDGAAVNTPSNAFTTSGTHDTTTDVTIAAGSGAADGNGVTLAGNATTFDGTTSSDTRTFGGTITGSGTTTGSFGLPVTGEGLAGEGAYSDVPIAYTANVYSGQSVWAGTSTGGSWGTLAAGFGANWGTNQGSPGLDANFASTDAATFNNVTGHATQLVSLDGASPSLNSITFNAPATSYTLAQGTGCTLTLNGGAGSATVTDTAGAHTISAPLTLTTNTNVSVASGQQLTFSGVVSGGGGLTNIGSGTTVISNANTYTGGTTLSTGTFDVMGAGKLGAATGSLTVAGGTLDLGMTNQTVGAVSIAAASMIQNGTLTGSSYAASASSGTASVNAVLAGAAALTKTGAGTLALNGASTYSGGTTISSGTVAAGNLSAFGTGNVTLTGGTLETGDGVHRINAASYIQTGGTLVLNLTGTSAGASPGYEFLNVTGTAALGGALQINVSSPYIPATGDTFSFVQAGSITGGFTSVSTNLFSLSITQQGDGVIIGQRPFATLPGITYTPNETAIAQYLDTSFTNGSSGPAFQTLLGALNSLTAAASSPNALPDAFSQLSPERFGSFAESTIFNNAVFSTQLFDGYLAGQRSPAGDFLHGNGQIDSSGLTVIDPTVDPSLAQLSSQLVAWSPAPLGHGMLSDTADPIVAGLDLKAMQAAIDPDQGRDFNVFVTGNVVLAQNFSQADLPHADTTTGAVQVGADYRITPHLRVGAIFGFGHTDADLDNNRSKATVDSYSPGAYLGFADNGWYANALGSYGFNSFTEDRHVSFGGLTGVAHGAPSGDQVVGNLDGGYDFHIKKWTFGPLAGLQYTHLDINSFTEMGATPADLQVNQQETDSLRSRLGGHVSYAFHTRKVVLTPHVDAYWQHEFLDQSRGITSQFTSVSAGSFTVNTPHPSRDSALIDCGLSADLDGQFSLYLDYVVQAGQSNYFGQSVQAGVKIGF